MNKINIINTIQESWGWTEIEPSNIIAENDFGNLIVKDINHAYWRICPEELYCKIVANTQKEFDILVNNKDFLFDWHMQELVKQAKDHLGDLQKNYKYYFVIPCILGGSYHIDNMKTLSLIELIGLSGDIGEQIKDLPDGSKIMLETTM